MVTAETRTVSEIAKSDSSTRLLERGTIVHRYVILDKLGEGGMGVVYTAYDPELDRQIALKILRTKTGKRDSGVSTKRLKREAQALAQLSHPNVINVHDVGIYDGNVFLAMEFVRGPNLRVWLRKNKPSLPEIIRTFVGAGRGLAAAHQAGLIHRDFKPDNVIVGDDGRVRVLDFGLARAAESEHDQTISSELNFDAGSSMDWLNEQTPIPRQRMSTASEHDTPSDAIPTVIEHRQSSSLLHVELTEADGLHGTPAYMSPEQFREEDVDSRSDQYSYCTALFEALCKFRPVKARNLDSLRRRVATGRLEQIPPERHIPRHIQHVLRRGLALDPDDRFPDMDTLLRELERDTASRLRTIGLLVATTLAVAVAIWALVRTQVESPSPCARAADRLQEVWNASAIGRLKPAFQNSGRPHWQDSLQRTNTVLGDYADRWAKTRVATCEATKVRGEQSERLLDLRMQCLDTRLARMDALLTILSSAPSGEIIDEAITAAYRLPSLAQCADSEALMALPPMPSDEQSRQRIATLSSDLHRAEAFNTAGRYQQGLELAQSIVEQARTLDYLPLLAESQYLAGLLAEQTGDSARAEKILLEAAMLAARIGDHTLGARSWTALLWTVGRSQARFAEADWLGHMARSMIVQTSEPKLLQATLASHQGSVAFAAGNTEESFVKHEAALAIRRAQLGESHPDVAESLSHLGASLYRQGRYAEAASHHRQALSTRIEALGIGHPEVGHSHLNLGLALVPQGKNTKAHQHYLRALEIYEASYGSQNTYVGIIHNNLGEYWWLQEQPERSKTHYQTSLQIFEKAHGTEHPFTAYALTGLGQSLTGLGAFSDAIAVLQRARDIREQSGATSAERSLTEFYLVRAQWQSGSARQAALKRASAAYEAYAKDPFNLDAESRLMRAWLETLDVPLPP